MGSQPNSIEVRDKKFHLQGHADARKHQEVGPFVIEKDASIQVEDLDGKAMTGMAPAVH